MTGSGKGWRDSMKVVTDGAQTLSGKDAGSVACAARERPRTPHGDVCAPSVHLGVAVLEVDDDVLALLELAADAVGDGDRAVAAAGAADRDRQVALALGDVGGDEEVEQRQQPAVELAGLGARLDVLTHPLVEPG